jgi:hypothetical protein
VFFDVLQKLRDVVRDLTVHGALAHEGGNIATWGAACRHLPPSLSVRKLNESLNTDVAAFDTLFFECEERGVLAEVNRDGYNQTTGKCAGLKDLFS